ncbi:MAG: hypothetical protein ACPGUC_08315 [Gammaproteobacteria bacterium]
MRIALLPTGRMEWEALPKALERQFSGHEFYAIPSEAEVQSNPDIGFPAPSFTSTDVLALQGKRNNADKLIERAVAEAIGDRRRTPADLVLILDDFELVNLNQADTVAATIRDAALRFLSAYQNQSQRQERYANALRERVSFHLAKPMIESWLFAGGEDVTKLLFAEDCTPRLLEGSDPECFQSTDTEYQEDTGEECTSWIGKGRRNNSRPAWLKPGIDRMIHPKAYLSWLHRNPSEKTCSNYSESGIGAQALGTLDWASLLANPEHAQFARAMIDDLAYCLTAPPPYPGQCANETATGQPADRVLRNL